MFVGQAAGRASVEFGDARCVKEVPAGIEHGGRRGEDVRRTDRAFLGGGRGRGACERFHSDGLPLSAN